MDLFLLESVQVLRFRMFGKFLLYITIRQRKKYVNDIFAFDPRDRSLLEVVLDLRFQNVAHDHTSKGFDKACSIWNSIIHHCCSAGSFEDPSSNTSPSFCIDFYTLKKVEREKKEDERKQSANGVGIKHPWEDP